MKKYILILIGFLFAVQLYAQVDAFNFKLSSKGHKRVIPVVNQSGTIHYVFVNKAELEIHWFEGTENRVITVPLERQVKKAKAITSFATDSQLFIYFWEQKAKKIDLLVVNKLNRSFDFKELFTLSYDEELLKIVRDKNSVHILVSKPRNVLKILTQDENVITTKEYEIPFLAFNKAISESLKDVFQDIYGKVGINQVSLDVANNLRSTLPFEKLYFINNIIYFTFDESTTTHLVRIDLNKQQCDYKKINFKLERVSNNSKGNSFLINDRLLRVTANQSQLNFCVVDLASFQLIKNYNLYPNEDFEIKNSQIITENNDVADAEFLSTKDFFNKIMQGDLGVAANVVDNNYEIIIGSEEVISVQRPSFGPGMGGGFPMTMGLGMGNSMMGPGFGNQNVAYTYTLTTSFKTLMTPMEFAHVKGPLAKNMIEKLRDFEDKAFGSNIPDFNTIYKYKGKIHYGYITKWNNTFYVVDF